MSFGGAVSAMVTSLKNNKRERKSLFDKKSNAHSSIHTKPFIDHKRLSPSNQEKLKLKIQHEQNVYKEKILILTLIAFIALGVLIYWLFVDSGKKLT